MSDWRPQYYAREALRAGAPTEVVANALAAAEIIRDINAEVAPVFTLRHLAHEADADYGLLRAIVRRSIVDPYRVFRIRKRPSYPGEKRFRMITVPEPHLMRTQRWITRNILAFVRPHTASVAFSRDDSIRAAAELHCSAKWLIKLNVRNFFESISEINVYRVFRQLGYQPLIAFEMTRLCTRVGAPTSLRLTERWRSDLGRRPVIAAYQATRMGHLPQGAPSSPMLANLAVRALDIETTQIAARHDLTFTRYADDLIFSTLSRDFTRRQCSTVINEVYEAMSRAGLSPNITKTLVSPPGARKIVLGLNVDAVSPRLTREFKDNLRQHLHFLLRPDVGPVLHARAKHFASVLGLKHHLQGLVSFACQIEPQYGRRCAEQLAMVAWPI